MSSNGALRRPQNPQQPTTTHKNSQEPTRTHKNPQELTRTHKNSQEPTRKPQEPKRTHKYPKELTRTQKNSQEPTRTQKNPQQPTRTHKKTTAQRLWFFSYFLSPRALTLTAYIFSFMPPCSRNSASAYLIYLIISDSA